MSQHSSTDSRERKKTYRHIDEYIRSDENIKMKSPDAPNAADDTLYNLRLPELDPFLHSVPSKSDAQYAPPPAPKVTVDGNAVPPNALHNLTASLYKMRWPSQLTSILAQLTHMLGHSNLIYFPNLCARYGGAAFLLPYFVSYVCVGIPLLYAEMILGQFSSLPPTEIFRRMSPPLAGIALAMLAVTIYRALYFSALISQLFYAAALTIPGIFTGSLPGSNCEDPEFSSNYCHSPSVERVCNTSRLLEEHYQLCDRYLVGLHHPNRVWVPPHSDYMIGAVFKPRFRANEIRMPSTAVSGILLAVWVFSSMCAFKGARRVACAFTCVKAISIFIVVVNLFISIFSQYGQDGGLTYFFSPDFSHLSDLETWSSAISHVLFSLNLGDGTVYRLASYNNFNENSIFNAMIISVSDVVVSLIAGATFFTSVGTISQSLYSRPDVTLQSRIRRTLFSGFTLSMTAFPDQLALSDAPALWTTVVSSAHYINLAKSGFSNLVMYLELIMLGVMDAFSRTVDWHVGDVRTKRATLLASIAVLGFTMSLVYAGPSGVYLTKLVDEFTGVALIIICLAEILTIIYAYGFRRLLANIETMMVNADRKWKMSITSLGPFYYVITPFFLVVGFILKTIYSHRSVMFDFIFPKSFELYGWLVVVSCTIVIPVTILYYMFRMRLRWAVMRALFEPTYLWGPVRPEDRERNIRNERIVRRM